jgi:hypothetical protein
MTPATPETSPTLVIRHATPEDLGIPRTFQSECPVRIDSSAETRDLPYLQPGSIISSLLTLLTVSHRQTQTIGRAVAPEVE